MKYFFLLPLLLLCFEKTSAQQLSNNAPFKQTDYLEKSKKQKKIARILMIGGAAVMLTSFVIPKGDLVEDGICVGPYCDDKYKNDNLKGGLFIGGGIAAIASIPFFIASSRNRKKAASLGLRIEKIKLFPSQNLSVNSFPVLGFQIQL